MEDEFYTQEDLDAMHEADEPDYYYCTCCNHTQTKPSFGRSCDNCGMFNVMEEGHY